MAKAQKEIQPHPPFQGLWSEGASCGMLYSYPPVFIQPWGLGLPWSCNLYKGFA